MNHLNSTKTKLETYKQPIGWGIAADVTFSSVAIVERQMIAFIFINYHLALP